MLHCCGSPRGSLNGLSVAGWDHNIPKLYGQRNHALIASPMWPHMRSGSSCLPHEQGSVKLYPMQQYTIEKGPQ